MGTMKTLPLNALRAFAAVHASGGVRAAARDLGVAHSAVSRHLKELEEWLGVPLTVPVEGGRGLAFTPQGEALGKAVAAGLAEIGRAVDALREVRSASSVVIATSQSFAARWLLSRLPALAKAQRGIEISVRVEQQLTDLERSDADFAIRMGSGPWPGFDCEPLMDEALYPVMSPVLWRAKGCPQVPGDLGRTGLLHDRDPQASWEVWKRVHGPASLNVRKGPRLTSSDLLLRAAALGQGVALARHRLACEDVAAGILVRPMQHLSVPVGISYWIVRTRAASVRPAGLSAIAWLKNAAQACGPAG
jgi:LysR family glycine cleavage system transcriptional activator